MSSKLDFLKISPFQAVIVVVLGVIAVSVISAGRFTIAHLVYLLVLIPAVILHEVSHGALALAYGDETAKNAGRLTLNPIKHVDPIGTIALPLILIFSFGFAFGYAKPVPVNVAHMSRNQAMFTSLVGPATNIVLALVVSLVVTLIGIGIPTWALYVLFYFGMVNVFLAAFNLLPIPPLDGSAVVERFLPSRYMAGYLKIRNYSMLILIALVLFLPGVLASVFGPAIGLWETTLPGWLTGGSQPSLEA